MATLHGAIGIIALVVPELSLPYFAQLADAVILAAEKHALTVLVEQTGAVNEREATVLRACASTLFRWCCWVSGSSVDRSTRWR